MRFKKLLVVVVSLLISILFMMNTLSLPSVSNDEIGLEQFSTLRAMAHMEVIAQKPHPAESTENEEVRLYLIDELQKLGLEPEIQSAYMEKYLDKWDVLVSGNVNNIVAKMEGVDDSDDAILLISHYDTVQTSPGAADATSGIVTILETLRAIKHNGMLKNDVIVLLSDGEEDGMLGAMAFEEKHAMMKNIKVVINLEARGNKGIVTMFETGDGNLKLINAMNKSIKQPFAFSASYEIYKIMSNDTDYSVFKEKGINGLNFANLEGGHTYHQMTDTPENYNLPTLQHYGDSILALMTHLGNAELNDLINTKTNSVFFSLTKNIFVNYSEIMVIPLTILIALVFVFVVVKNRKSKQLKLKKVMFGILMNIVTLVVVYFAIAPLVMPMYGMLMNSKNIESESLQWYASLADLTGNMSNMIIYVLITLALLSLASFIVRKFMNKKEMVGSALTIWILMMIVTSFTLKGISYMFTWTSLMFVMYYAFDSLMSESKMKENITFFLMFLSIFVAVNIYGMFIYLIYLALTVMMAAVVMVALALYGILLMAILFGKDQESENTITYEKLAA